ncbi:MAG: hypothetical protein OXF98_10825 [Rhodospirillaceae bacterium]|nr:hypothetical protein [Rhodospirillaceae bacterium]
MRVETEIKKWGNSLALRVTGLMAELPQFEPGTRVTVDIDSEGFVVRRAAGSLRSFRFPESESALLEGMTAENAHADLLAVPTRRELGM